MPRAFIAIDIPETIKKTIITKISKPLLKHRISKQIKWTKKENLHITLVFLGNITDTQCQEINKKIQDAITLFQSFSISLRDLKPFPTTKKFHVLILEPRPLEPIQKLALAIKNSVETSGTKTDSRQFKPHLTLGRVSDKNIIVPKIFTKIQLPTMHFEVTEIKLFKSEPGPKGSVYTPIATYTLDVTGSQSNNFSERLRRWGYGSRGV